MSRRSKKALKYIEYTKSSRWSRKKKAAKKRAGGKCVLCGSTEKLIVHHISYKNLGNEPPEDLLVVCEKCHNKIHNR